MTNDGLNTLAYDGENRTTSSMNGSSSGTYTYDGGGSRVQRVSGTTTTVYIFSGSKVVAEYDNGAAPTAPSREYIYAGATLLARIDSTGTKYFHRDHLSNRMVTDSTSHIVEQTAHYPYGESWYNTAGDKLFFTTYERDSESGNDYAQARYYVSRLGRFSSVDPLAGATGDPQSLNRYVYGRDLPTVLVDPSGTCGQLIESRRKAILHIESWGMGIFPSEAEDQDDDPLDCIEGGGGSGGGGGAWGGDGTSFADGIPPDLPLPGECPVLICIVVTANPPGVDFYNPPLTNPYYNDPSNDPGLGPFGEIQVGPGGGGFRGNSGNTSGGGGKRDLCNKADPTNNKVLSFIA